MQMQNRYNNNNVLHLDQIIPDQMVVTKHNMKFIMKQNRFSYLHIKQHCILQADVHSWPKLCKKGQKQTTRTVHH